MALTLRITMVIHRRTQQGSSDKAGMPDLDFIDSGFLEKKGYL